MSGQSRPARQSRLDPTGKRALFETPVVAAPDTLRTGSGKAGRDALFSAGPREPGTVVVACSDCLGRTRVGIGNLAVRLASFSIFLPVLKGDHPHRMKCPTCHRITWCRIGWAD